MQIPAAWGRLETGRRAEGRRQARMRASVRAHASGQTTAARVRPLDPPTSAKAAGLRYVDDRTLPGIRRVGAKSRVRYVLPNGRTLTDSAELQRIRSLAIP